MWFFISFNLEIYLNECHLGMAYASPMALAMKWFPLRKGEANAAVLCN